MIWSDHRRFCFIHIPKTAGTAVRTAYLPHALLGDVLVGGGEFGNTLRDLLRAHYGLHGHSGAGQVMRLFGRERFEAMFSFAVVRDPLDRMISFYRWIHGQEAPLTPHQPLLAYKDLASFVPAAIPILAPQATFVLKPGPETPLVTRLYRHDQLAEAWPEICERIGVAMDLPAANVSPPLPVEVTPAIEAGIREAYARDYAMLERLPG
jgi:hypothetical protein